MRCQDCGTELKEGVLFCRECGAKVTPMTIRFCRECGHHLAEGSKYCVNCGADVYAAFRKAEAPVKEKKVEDNVIRQIRCPNCAAPVMIDPKRGRRVQCEYCNSEILINLDTWKAIAGQEEMKQAAQDEEEVRQKELLRLQEEKKKREETKRQEEAKRQAEAEKKAAAEKLAKIRALTEEEEKAFKSWLDKWNILLVLYSVITFILSYAIATSSSSSRASDEFVLLFPIWIVFHIVMPLYVSTHRPSLTYATPHSHFAKGSRLICFLKVKGIQWAVFVAILVLVS